MRHAITLRLRRMVNLPLLRALCVTALCLLIIASAALGQSGRKQKKPDQQPPVQGINQPEARVTPEPPAAPEKPKEKEKGPVIMVGTELPDMNISSFYTDIARQACAREMRQVPTLQINEARDLHRSDAIKAAKNDERTTVVLMELRASSVDAGGFDLRYTIFEPKTAKVIGTGSGYPAQPNDSLPLPPIGATRAEIMVEWAGRDVGRQVLKKLKLKL
jgi:hypothetical protein